MIWIGNKKIFIKEMEQAKLSIWVDADQAEKLLKPNNSPYFEISLIKQQKS